MDHINNVIKILVTSKTLKDAIPYVRRLALLETILQTNNIEFANNVFLENLLSSPYIPDEHKNNLAELVFSSQWTLLFHMLKCDNYLDEININKFRSFQQMVITIFTKSKKIARITNDKRMQLGRGILCQTSIEGLKELALRSLETSEVFDNDARNLVANDIIDNRYDLLLLPDRFDCEDYQRKNDDDLEECPICLGLNRLDTKLPCGHKFCRSCIESWGQQNTQCPMCRADFNISQISNI